MGPSPTGTMFKFVASDGIGSSQKRHQARRACENCRRRKKACHHGEGPFSKSKAVQDENSSAIQGSASLGHISYTAVDDQPSDRPQAKDVTQECTPAETESLHGGNSVTTSNEETQNPRIQFQAKQSHQILHRQEDQNFRFIGDLSPEGIFLSATSPDATRGGSVGIWLTNKTASQTTKLHSPSNLFYGTGPLIKQVLVPMLEQECLSALPAPARLDALIKIYFDKVYPILPVVAEADYQDLPTTDPHRVLLQQGICLAASKNIAARQHLVLDESALPLSCREFGEKLSGVMRMSIEMGLVTIKTVIIQALTLLHQFTDNPIGEDFTSHRAVHHVQSIGLHLREGQDRSSSTLFCCVWAIDKLNAALYGRTVQMHERDLSVDLPSHFEAQEPSFRLFLHVIALLDKVIDIYRPASSENPMLTWDFDSFEDVVLKSTTEILYHAVAILSCRSKSWADPQRSSTSYLRQSLSTATLSSTVSCEDHSPTLFPFVPYAMSLSMSIAYREMRHSKLTLHRTRSRKQFQILCDALSKLEGIFWSASATSETGKKLLKEMDRVFSTVIPTERRQEQYLAQNERDVQASSSLVPQNEDQNDMNMNGNISNQPIQDVDPSIFGSIPDIDLFGMFDPAFDLDSFDACLEGNLNPAFPTNFQ
ncbi:uncharacterized protein PAC_00690 [Phialocephala subalpina]|uniref:Xylanolytic transcriptional activator regulatory domain-containing protein n=1 Tax=Phialocephala subalpina TaxID=576137 RepID=A0A1L7WDG3_9HELO|nr:uncharacterized protein PAC_00690 [Phialocephala subalpina]